MVKGSRGIRASENYMAVMPKISKLHCCTEASRIGCVVRVPSLPSEDSGFGPRSWQLGEYATCVWSILKKEANVRKFMWAHLKQIIRGVGKSQATPRICNWESVVLSSIVPKILASGAWKIWSPKWPTLSKGTPEVLYLYFTLLYWCKSRNLIATPRP